MADPKKHQPAEQRWINKRLGKFRLLSLLGQGAMGKVFLAEDTTLHRQVALKVLSAKTENNQPDQKAKQFIREARAAAKLNHPHIVNVLEINEQKDLLYIAMDLVQGGDVKQLIKHSGQISPARACDLAADAADALAFGHRLGIIHRDVKPSNLMLTRDGRCKLADFGLADLGDPNDDFRMPDGIIGTPSYMAPEVAQGLPALPASDQYSLGCTVWHMLTGRPVFADRDWRKVLDQQIHEPPTPLAELCPDLPASLVEAVETAMAKDPADRHGDCEVFARLLRGHSMAMQPPGGSMALSMSMASGSLVRISPPASAKRRGTWLIAGTAAAVVTLGGLGAWWATSRGAMEMPVTPAPAPAPVTQATPAPPAPTPVPALPDPPDDVDTDEPAPPPELKVSPIPAEPPPASPPPTFTADQTEQIKPLVADDAVVTVTGVVDSAQLSASGKTFMVKFAGNDTGDFQVIWKPSVYADMAAAFGGTNGEGIAGQKLRVTGELSSMFGTPQIEVTSPTQIEILE